VTIHIVIRKESWQLQQENIQKDTWWVNELESLCVSPKVRNELNDIQETSNPTEILNNYFIRPIKKHILNNNNDENPSVLETLRIILYLLY
jgi:hypothetical protein